MVYRLLENTVLLARAASHCVGLTRPRLPVQNYRAVDAIECVFDQVLELREYIGLFGFFAEHLLKLKVLCGISGEHADHAVFGELVASFPVRGVKLLVVEHLADAQVNHNKRGQVWAFFEEERLFLLSHWSFFDRFLRWFLCRNLFN